MLHNIEGQSYVDVSGQHIGPTFRGQELFLTCLTFEVVPIGCPETLLRNYHSTLRNIAEEALSSYTVLVCRPNGFHSVYCVEEGRRYIVGGGGGSACWDACDKQRS